MENSKTGGAVSQQPPSHKKKKSKNKKNVKTAPAEVELLAEADKAASQEVNLNGLSEELSHKLSLNDSSKKNTKSLNNTASVKGRREDGNKLVSNGNAEKEFSVSESVCHVNGHDRANHVELSSIDTADYKSNGSEPFVGKQPPKKSKSKSNKLKNKGAVQENSTEINLMQPQKTTSEMELLTQQEMPEQSLQNGFRVGAINEQKIVEHQLKEQVTLSVNESNDEVTDECVKKEMQNTNSINGAAEQSSSTTPTPATTAESTNEAHPAVKLDTPKTIETTAEPILDLSNVHIEYKEYESELQMHDIMRLIQAELSEPYSIYTYRYFIYNWPKLCFLAAHGNEYIGAIVCKLDRHMNVKRGYIAMLAVRKEYRKMKIGTTLVQKAIEAMLADDADEVVLETEMRNLPALRLYENLGFVRDKRLFRYYLNGVDALRLKLWFR